jgi:hypothetical protein
MMRVRICQIAPANLLGAFMRKGIWIATAAFGAAALATAALAAGMGKPGLWEVTTHADISGLTANLTPEQREKMKSMGINIPENNTFTFSHCMTPEEAAMIKPPPMNRLGHENECRTTNLKTTGHTASADMVCDGPHVKGGGHFEFTYDTPEHYTGKIVMDLDTGIHRMASTTTFEAKWLGSDCKAK